jgi:(p)ppGpp synthase/HD superfamily hydrolase
MTTKMDPRSSGAVWSPEDLVLESMRLAERAHRPQRRKAPEGQDRPAYYLHLVEVAWMLQDVNMDGEVVAAGYLHDMIEDCGYTQERLTEETGNPRVAELVQWVSEPEKDKSWEVRNGIYLERMRGAPMEVLTLSCADKTSNLRDMLRLIDRGYVLDSFLSVGKEKQVAKFDGLDKIYSNVVPVKIHRRYSAALKKLSGA